MKTHKGKATRNPAHKDIENTYVKGHMLAAFIADRFNAVAESAAKVQEEKKDVQGVEKVCKYYVDGAHQFTDMIMDLIPPVHVPDIIKASAGFVNGLAKDVDKIAEETDTPKELVLSYINGARKMSDILIEALARSPREEVETNKEDEKHE